MNLIIKCNFCHNRQYYAMQFTYYHNKKEIINKKNQV